MSTPRMTRSNSLQSQPCSFERSPDFHCLNHVTGTSGRISTRLRKYWADDPLINLHQKNDGKPYNRSKSLHLHLQNNPFLTKVCEFLTEKRNNGT